MKKRSTYCWYSCLLAGCIYCSIFFSSCDTYNFSQPQPADRENIYEFPDIFRGNWIIKSDSESVVIDKQHVRYIYNQYKQKIAMGAWPRPDGKGDLTGPPMFGRSIARIRYDSLLKPIDTIPNYVLSKGFIYAISYDSLLETGYPYVADADTIVVSSVDTAWVDLGQNAFLRKLNDNMYVINIRNRILSREDAWWQVSVLEKRPNGNIRILSPGNKFYHLPGLLYEKDSNYYFDNKFTAADVEQLIRDGYLVAGIILHKDTRK